MMMSKEYRLNRSRECRLAFQLLGWDAPTVQVLAYLVSKGVAVDVTNVDRARSVHNRQVAAEKLAREMAIKAADDEARMARAPDGTAVAAGPSPSLAP
jgi:hypothetical protein